MDEKSREEEVDRSIVKKKGAAKGILRHADGDATVTDEESLDSSLDDRRK